MKIKRTTHYALRTTIILFSLLFLLSVSSYAQDTEQKRTVLALYDSSEYYNLQSDSNIIHKNAEMPLNYLGMKVRFHDVNKNGLPSDESLKDVCAIMSWYQDEKLPQSAQYCRWAAGQVKRGRKFIVLGNFGAYKDSATGDVTSIDALNQLYNAIGLYYDFSWTDNPFVIGIKEKVSDMVEFERTLEGEAGDYEKMNSISSGNKAYLTIYRKDRPDSDSVAVSISPGGALAMDGYDVFIDYISATSRWRINPFLFFNEALQLKDMPRFDTTTLFGRRIFYSHIDGDGIRNVSDIGRDNFCGNIILNEILKKYDLPITASFITADIDPKYFGSQRLLDLAREISRLDNVEIGAHGFTHPLDWNRQLTVYEIKNYSHKAASTAQEELVSESAYGNVAVITVNRQDFVNREIKQAVEYINNNVAPPGKKVAIYQWTGNCRPTKEAIDLANSLGLQNINGGDTRFDGAAPSYTRVAPLTRQIDGRVQVYASNMNENIYTNSWSGPFYGFLDVIETFKQTEIPTVVKAPPRRVSPINVYYHYYSGEKNISLDTLKKVYDYALTQDIIPIFTSDYTRVVNGFLSAKAKRLADNAWEFSDYGSCRTVRFDNCVLSPDLKKSKGILGFKRWQDSLYIHLAEGNQAVLYMTSNAPSEPYLGEASTVPYNFAISNTKILFKTTGYREGVYKFVNMSPNIKYKVTLNSGYVKEFMSGPRGELEIKIPTKGSFEVVIEKE